MSKKGKKQKAYSLEYTNENFLQMSFTISENMKNLLKKNMWRKGQNTQSLQQGPEDQHEHTLFGPSKSHPSHMRSFPGDRPAKNRKGHKLEEIREKITQSFFTRAPPMLCLSIILGNMAAYFFFQNSSRQKRIKAKFFQRVIHFRFSTV